MKIGYVCSYFERMPLNYTEDIEIVYIGSLLNQGCKKEHFNNVALCAYPRYIINNLCWSDIDCLIIPNCCNGMQRLYDYYKDHGKKVYMIETYNSSFSKFNSCDKNEIDELCDWINEKAVGKEKICFNNTPLFNNISIKEIECDEYILIIGNVLPEHLMKVLQSKFSDFKLLVCSCNYIQTNNENIIYLSKYANIPCIFEGGFEKWIASFLKEHEKKIEAIICCVSASCAAGMMIYRLIEELAKDVLLPCFYLETEYGAKYSGQIDTRISAIYESLALGERKRINSLPSSQLESSNDFYQKMRLVKYILPQMQYESLKLLIDYQLKVLLDKAVKAPEKIVWTNMVMPLEYFYAAGLVPIQIEMVAGWIASLGLATKYISIAEKNGIKSSICSYHKAVLGLMLSQAEYIPRVVVVSSTICDGGMAFARVCRELFKTQSFILPISYNFSDRSVDTVKRYCVEMRAWIQKICHTEINVDNLERAAMSCNVASQLWKKANELRIYDNSYEGRVALRNMFGATFLFGSEVGVSVAKKYYEDISKQNDGDNKYRILWVHFGPLHNNKVLEYFENDLSCHIVVDIVNYIYWDEYNLQDIDESIAKRLLAHFYVGNVEKRKQLYRQEISNYHIDGVVHFMQKGCTAITTSSWVVSDVCKELNIPYLELYGDCIDPNGFSIEQAMIRIEAFKEVLDRRGSKRI